MVKKDIMDEYQQFLENVHPVVKKRDLFPDYTACFSETMYVYLIDNKYHVFKATIGCDSCNRHKTMDSLKTKFTNDLQNIKTIFDTLEDADKYLDEMYKDSKEYAMACY